VDFEGQWRDGQVIATEIVLHEFLKIRACAYEEAI